MCTACEQAPQRQHGGEQGARTEADPDAGDAHTLHFAKVDADGRAHRPVTGQHVDHGCAGNLATAQQASCRRAGTNDELHDTQQHQQPRCQTGGRETSRAAVEEPVCQWPGTNPQCEADGEPEAKRQDETA